MCLSVSYTVQEADCSQYPLGGLLFGLEVKGPNVCGSSHRAGLVDRTFVYVLGSPGDQWTRLLRRSPACWESAPSAV